MRRWIMGAVAALAATGASAQTTTCGEEIGKWVCRTQPQVTYPNIYANGMEAFRKAQEQQAQIMRNRQEAQAMQD